MNSSSEFIRGYTEMIILSILSEGDDYIYSIGNKINDNGEGFVTVSNPSLLIVLKTMFDEGKVTTYNVLNERNVNRKFYQITDFGRSFYKDNINDYITSLAKLKMLLERGTSNEKKDRDTY